MADEYVPSTEEVRSMANSYDGVPNDVFDRWLSAHDAEIHAAGVAEGIRQARAAAQRAAESNAPDHPFTAYGARQAVLLIDALETSCTTRGSRDEWCGYYDRSRVEGSAHVHGVLKPGHTAKVEEVDRG